MVVKMVRRAAMVMLMVVTMVVMATVMVMIERSGKDEEGQEDDQEGDALRRATSEPGGAATRKRGRADHGGGKWGEGGEALLWGNGGTATRSISLKGVGVLLLRFCYYNCGLYMYQTATTGTSRSTAGFACLARIMRVGCWEAGQLSETARLREKGGGGGGGGGVC